MARNAAGVSDDLRLPRDHVVAIGREVETCNLGRVSLAPWLLSRGVATSDRPAERRRARLFRADASKRSADLQTTERDL